jgi:hypothetical protein
VHDYIPIWLPRRENFIPFSNPLNELSTTVGNCCPKSASWPPTTYFMPKSCCHTFPVRVVRRHDLTCSLFHNSGPLVAFDSADSALAQNSSLRVDGQIVLLPSVAVTPSYDARGDWEIFRWRRLGALAVVVYVAGVGTRCSAKRERISTYLCIFLIFRVSWRFESLYPTVGFLPGDATDCAFRNRFLQRRQARSSAQEWHTDDS